MQEKFLGLPDIEGESDPTEKLFAQIAHEQGLILCESGIIKLPGKKENKWDKRSTVPDFLVKKNEEDEGVYVEITVRSEQSAKKNRQRKVMQRAGLSDRYVQLTGEELKEIQENNIDLFSYIENKKAA